MSMGMEAVDFLESLGIQVEKKIYEGLQHTINDQEVLDLSDWLVEHVHP